MAGFVENVNKLATDLTPAVISGIANVVAHVAELETLQNNIEDVNTIAGNIAAINAVAANEVNINIVAGDSADIGIVVDNIEDIKATSLNMPNINSVAENETNINTVANASVDIEVVADNIADIDAVVAQIIPNLAEILLADDNAAIATTQAGIATTKASEASASAIAAALSASEAATLLDMFDDRYLGSKEADPLVDNDGNPLLIGALYFNTLVNKMRVWDGTAWADSLTLTAGSISVLTNKTIDDISNKVGADHIHYPVRNGSGSTLVAGTVVRAASTQPGTDYIVVLPVTDPQTQIALGVLHSTIANNGTGLCMNTGVCADTIDTSGWAVGTILYPNASGGLTSTKPTSGQYQACAIVLRSHTTQGTMLVEFTEPKYIASTTQSGYVQLNDTLASTSTTQALTAAQGKVLQDTTEKLTNKGVANGYASLDAAGLVPTAQLPSYVDDVLEYANLASFPATGETGKIYVALDTNKTYRWSGSTYVYITSGAVDSVNGQTGAVSITDITGNAGTATKLQTARTISLTGDVTGSVTFDGSSNASISTTVADDSHTHSFNNITSKPTTLDGYGITDAASNTHSHTLDELSNTTITSNTAGEILKWDGTAWVNNTLTEAGIQPAGSYALQSDLNFKVGKDSDTGAMYMPYGTTAQRPATPSTGYMRFNTDLGKAEVWNGSVWAGVGGGATGGGADTVFVENEYTITESYTIPTGKSAVSVGDANGDIHFNAGVEVTFANTSSRWVVL